MHFDIITIFPSLFDSFLSESIIKRAQDKKHITINIHYLRDFTNDNHQTVDDKPFGGGLGMVMKVEPIQKAINTIKQRVNSKNPRVILFTPRGKRFNQQRAIGFTKYDHLIMICGRYEGIDERVARYIADEKISIGNYVLMGGEIPAMIVTETVSRLIPGVIGKKEFLLDRKKDNGFVEYPQYTRPETVVINNKKRSVPSVLLTGDHKKINQWKEKKGKTIK